MSELGATEGTNLTPVEQLMVSRINPEIDAVMQELCYAQQKWGDGFDDANTINDWVTYLTMYATDAAKMGADFEEQYAGFIKAAGLALNAASRLRRGAVAPRHYEGQPSRGHLNTESFKR